MQTIHTFCLNFKSKTEIFLVLSAGVMSFLRRCPTMLRERDSDVPAAARVGGTKAGADGAGQERGSVCHLCLRRRMLSFTVCMENK